MRNFAFLALFVATLSGAAVFAKYQVLGIDDMAKAIDSRRVFTALPISERPTRGYGSPKEWAEASIQADQKYFNDRNPDQSSIVQFRLADEESQLMVLWAGVRLYPGDVRLILRKHGITDELKLDKHNILQPDEFLQGLRAFFLHAKNHEHLYADLKRPGKLNTLLEFDRLPQAKRDDLLRSAHTCTYDVTYDADGAYATVQFSTGHSARFVIVKGRWYSDSVLTLRAELPGLIREYQQSP